MSGRLIKKFLMLVFLLVTHNVALAYKVTTHQTFSLYATDSSVLNNDPSLLSDFGLGLYGALEFTSSNNDLLNIRDIIAFGAQFEDDGGSTFQRINPFITKRSLRHFFDPQTGGGLTLLIGGSFLPSPDWALERTSGGAVLDLQNPEQAYSYQDARNYFFTALTCQTTLCRQDNFSKTFQTIGHVIHHLQDMGQPQHSRLDTHLFEPRSFYEKYTAAKKDSELPALINANPFPPPAGGNYFNLPGYYWQTQTGDGQGMAEFSGTNFVTMGTMFRRDKNTASGFSSNKNFLLPTGATVTESTLQTSLTGIGGEMLTDNIDFLEATIIDPLKGPPGTKVKLATVSILDAHLNDNELGFDGEPLSVLTVNSKVFDDRLAVLAPRIAAFSTDFINYFFRGRIDMVKESGSTNSWRIVNNSTETMSGQFDVYAEANGNRDIVTGWNLTIPAGSSSAPQTFQVPTTFVSNYVLVFKGQLGVEVDAVAGKVIALDLCTDSDMAIWVANDNNVTDDNFQLRINGSYLTDLVLGTNDCNGHMVLPQKFSGFGKSSVSFHPDVTSQIGGCLPSWDSDASSGLRFSSNVPATKANSSYQVNLKNIQNNSANNFGTLYSFQVCPHPSNGRPFVRRLLSSATYSGSSGLDIGPFNFSTGQCLPCDDLDNNGNFPDNRVTVNAVVSGSGICSATAQISGPTTTSRSISSLSNGTPIPIKLLPGRYSLDLSFNNGCGLGSTSNTVSITLKLNGATISSAGFLNTADTFVVPAVPGAQ